MSDDGPSDAELFDVSGVTFDIKQTRNRKEIALVAKSDRDFTLFSYYLALKAYVEKIEHEIGVLDNQQSTFQ